MSQGMKIPRSEALPMAKAILGHLGGVCQRIEIAGSLRRGRQEVGNIEIVCIPVEAVDLFGVLSYLWGDVRDALAMFPMLKGGDRYQQYDLGRCKADVFVTTREQWGVIFTIRTGSAAFSHKLVKPQTYGGYLPDWMTIQEGRLWRGSVSIETLEEVDLFRAIGLIWIPPEKR